VRITLTQNYRSPNSLLGISNWLLKTSAINYDKELWSEIDGSVPPLRVFPDQFEEAEFIADKIQNDHERGIPYRNNLILFRSSFWRKALDSALAKRKIPVTYYGGMSFLQAKHIRDIVSALRLLHNPADEIAWLRYLQIFSGIGDESASELVGRLSDFTSLDDRLALVRSSGVRFARPAVALAEIKARIESALSQLIAHIVNVLSDDFQKLYRQEWAARSSDVPILQALAEREESIASFLENYALNPITESRRGPNDPISDCVIVSTIHSAKGLESDFVYVPALQPGHYPPTRAKSQEEVEEERRALYVALTRAKVELNLSKSMSVTYQRVPKGSAYFLADMPNSLVKLDVQAVDNHKTPPVTLDYEGSSFGIEL
jgi:DNA helicase-2/ATP-dependent DNA helicase PcrA